MSIKTKKIIAAAAAFAVTASLLTACGANKAPDETTAPADTSLTLSTTDGELVVNNEESEGGEVEAATTAAIKDGDIYAIDKFNAQLPEGYELAASSEQQQGLIYVNQEKKAQITVRAMNYKEDKPLADFADSACATIKMNNLLFKTDTEFEEPQNVTVAGFDTVLYNFATTENVYNEGSEEATPVAWYKQRAYYFYSDKDVYWIIIETPKDMYDSNSADFDAFISSISIDENAVNGKVRESVNGSEIQTTVTAESFESEASAAE